MYSPTVFRKPKTGTLPRNLSSTSPEPRTQFELNLRGLLDSRTGGSDMQLPLPERRVAEAISQVRLCRSRLDFYPQSPLCSNHLSAVPHPAAPKHGGNGMDLPGPDRPVKPFVLWNSQQTLLLSGWKANIFLQPNQTLLNASLGQDLLNDSTPGLQRSLTQQAFNGNLGLQLSWNPKPLAV